MHKESWMNWIWCNFVQIARSYIHNRVKSFLKGKFYFLGPLLCHKIFMKHLYIIGMKIGKINAVRYTYVWHMFQSIAGFPILLLYKVFKKNHTVLLKNFSQENYLWNACKSDSWLNLLQSLSLTAILVQCQPHLNHQTKPFWVKGVWLVPNSPNLKELVWAVPEVGWLKIKRRPLWPNVGRQCQNLLGFDYLVLARPTWR